MRISSITLRDFRRFADLHIKNIPQTARLVVLVGANGSGKSSLFDALLLRYRCDSDFGWRADKSYYDRSIDGREDVLGDAAARVAYSTHEGQTFGKGSIYFRTAYRHDPSFNLKSLSRQGDVLNRLDLYKMIEANSVVADNYGRLASQAMEGVFVSEDDSVTIGDYREKVIGEIKRPLARLFPGLNFVGIGNPLSEGTFKFKKGDVTNFDYQNLSGGEKAAFDLILDIVVKRNSYLDSIYCIDEPEAHISTKTQGLLLEELLGLVPETSQLWIASHSIGMMKKARELYDEDPSSVVFLDFDDKNFDEYTEIVPTKPNRDFWGKVLHVALDDLASLVAPREIVICEGCPAGTRPGKNVEHDARIYSIIFFHEMPDVNFISAGSSSQICGDFLALATALPKVASGMSVRRLIDRDDHSPADVKDLEQRGIKVLGRRHIESYLYDEEVLAALCDSVGKSDKCDELLEARRKAISDSVSRGNPSDDLKSAAGDIFNYTKRILELRSSGNDQHAFSRNTLAPLLVPSMDVYAELKADIFGN